MERANANQSTAFGPLETPRPFTREEFSPARDRRQHRSDPVALLKSIWPLLLGLIAVVGAWTKIEGDVAGKVDRIEYVQAKARSDSIAGQTLTEVRRIGNALCRVDPRTCP